MSTEQASETAPAVESAPAAVAATTTATEASGTNLQKFTAGLGAILHSTGHPEMWGVELKENPSHAPTQVVLEKFLRANNQDVSAATKQLLSALEWRKKYQPLSLVKDTFNKAKFEDLGYVTVHRDGKGEETVITWNIYGAVKDNKATFGDVEEFIKWRAAIMELGVQKLRINEATAPLPETGPDPYQAIQVHDYKSVAFFRMDPNVKAASKETITTFSMAYPELLRHKYFVNVPALMGWMYAAMKLFLAPATLKKFHPMSSGLSLAPELPSIAESLPKEYGGKAPRVQEVGETVALAATEGKKEALVAVVTESEAEPDTKEEAKTDTVKTEDEVVEAKPTEKEADRISVD